MKGLGLSPSAQQFEIGGVKIKTSSLVNLAMMRKLHATKCQPTGENHPLNPPLTSCNKEKMMQISFSLSVASERGRYLQYHRENETIKDDLRLPLSSHPLKEGA